MSVNAPAHSSYKAEAELLIDDWSKKYKITPQEPNPITDRGVYGPQYYPDDVRYVAMVVALYMSASGPITQPNLSSSMIYLDPEITIDHDQMINIDGVDYPANQLYRVEISKNLLVTPEKPKAIPAIPLLLRDESKW